MKYPILIIAITLIGFTHPIFAQENDSLAKKSFAMAEDAYSNGQYKEVVDFIKYAEIYSGGANSRSLYLKIKALDQLSNKFPSYLPALQSSLDRFFEVTDKSSYPYDKYSEITMIMSQRRPAAAPAASGTSSTPVSSAPKVTMTAPVGKNAQEQADYDKAVKLNTIEAYKEFLDTYSYTPHYGDVKRRYDDKVEDMKEYRNHRIKH